MNPLAGFIFYSLVAIACFYLLHKNIQKDYRKPENHDHKEDN